jgi:hypothetical protein
MLGKALAPPRRDPAVVKTDAVADSHDEREKFDLTVNNPIYGLERYAHLTPPTVGIWEITDELAEIVPSPVDHELIGINHEQVGETRSASRSEPLIAHFVLIRPLTPNYVQM